MSMNIRGGRGLLNGGNQGQQQGNAQGSGRNFGASGDDSWKADGFLNLYLPGKTKKRKVGYISLRGDNDLHNQLLVKLLDKDEAVAANALKLIREKLIVEFNSADANDNNPLDLEGF